METGENGVFILRILTAVSNVEEVFSGIPDYATTHHLPMEDYIVLDRLTKRLSVTHNPA
jgi:hypothetical protein